MFFPEIFSLASARCFPLHVCPSPKQTETAKLISGRIPLLRGCTPKTLPLLVFHILSCFGEQYASHLLPLPSLREPPPWAHTHCLSAPSWHTSNSFDTCVLPSSWKVLSLYILTGALSHCSSLRFDVPLPERPSLTTHQSDFPLFRWHGNIHQDWKLLGLFVSLFIIWPPHCPSE